MKTIPKELAKALYKLALSMKLRGVRIYKKDQDLLEKSLKVAQ